MDGKGLASLRRRRDVLVLRETTGIHEAFGADDGNSDATAELFETLWQRTLLRMHTFGPDTNEIQRWMDDLFEWMESDEELRERYAALLASGDEPDQEFYEEDDSVIRLLHGTKAGASDAPDIDRAISRPQRSDYARVVRDAYRTLETTSEYLLEKCSRETLRDRVLR